MIVIAATTIVKTAAVIDHPFTMATDRNRKCPKAISRSVSPSLLGYRISHRLHFRGTGIVPTIGEAGDGMQEVGEGVAVAVADLLPIPLSERF